MEMHDRVALKSASKGQEAQRSGFLTSAQLEVYLDTPRLRQWMDGWKEGPSSNGAQIWPALPTRPERGGGERKSTPVERRGVRTNQPTVRAFFFDTIKVDGMVRIVQPPWSEVRLRRREFTSQRIHSVRFDICLD